MDNSTDHLDIPVLTKVHVSKEAKTALVDLRKGDAPHLDAASIASIIDQVKQTLIPEILQLVKQQIDHSVPSIEVDTSVIEQQLTKTQTQLMEKAQLQLEQDSVRINKELTESFNSEVASKITGMQELAVNQARSQLKNNLGALEQGFKEAMEMHTKQQTQVFESLFQQHQTNAQQTLAEQVQNMSNELLQVVAAYNQKLTDESQTKISEEHARIFETKQAELVAKLETQFKTLADAQKNAFLEAMDAELPAVEEKLMQKINGMISAELPRIEAEVSAKIKTNIVEVLQAIKFVFPNT